MTTEAMAPEVAPATKLSMKVELWLLVSRDRDRELVLTDDGSRKSVRPFLTAS